MKKSDPASMIPVEDGTAATMAHVLMMTENMLDLARDDRWEDIAKIEESRREVLSSIFSSEVPDSHTELFSEALAAMLHMNEELISLLEVAKANVAIKRGDQTRVKRSIGHYLDVEKEN